MVVTRAISSSSPSRSGISYSMTRTCRALAGVQVLPGAGGLDELLPGRGLDLRGDQDRPVGAVGEDLQHGQPDVGLEPPQQRRPGVRGGAPVRPVVEAAVGDQQPVLLQLRVEPAGQRPLAAGLERERADRGQHRRVRRALADRDHLGLGERARRPVLPGPRVAEARPRSPGCPGRPTPSRRCSSAATARGTPPAVSIVATGLATCENSSAIGSGPRRCRAWVIPPDVGARPQDSSQPSQSANVPASRAATSS